MSQAKKRTVWRPGVVGTRLGAGTLRLPASGRNSEELMVVSVVRGGLQLSPKITHMPGTSYKDTNTDWLEFKRYRRT